MNIGKLSAIVALTAALGTGSALAATGADDESGFTTLGIDISGAGSSAESVHQFLAGLAPDTRRELLGGCQTAVSYPVSYAPNVVAFCATATGAAGSGMSSVLGYAPVERRAGPAMGGTAY